MGSRQQNYLPVLLLFLATFVTLTPVPFAGSTSVMPCFPLIAVFYWSLLRPAQLPVVALFLAGLVLDAFIAPAMGMNILLLLFMRLFVSWFASRFARQTIWFFWSGFWMMSLPCWLIYWMTASIVSDHVLSLLPLLMQWGFTSLWYPLLHLAFTRCLTILPHTR